MKEERVNPGRINFLEDLAGGFTISFLAAVVVQFIVDQIRCIIDIMESILWKKKESKRRW